VNDLPNGFAKVVSMLLFVLLILFAVYQNFRIQDDVASQNTYNTVTQFVDNVRTKGFITPKMYEDFQKQLDIGNYHFDIEMVHKQKIYTPDFKDPKDDKSFTGEYLVDYDEFYKDQIEDVLYGQTSKPSDKRMYKLQQDDYFSVSVENANKTNSSILFDFLTNNTGDEKGSSINVSYGGMVLNEDY